MTREEAISIMKVIVHMLEEKYDTDRVEEAVDMAIKALEQEPCEDAISRQAALDAFGLSEKTRKYGGDHSGYDTMMLYEIQQTLEDLPTVTPKQRTGHWKIKRASIHPYGNDVACSECGFTMGSSFGYKYCPSCGAKMESEGQA